MKFYGPKTILTHSTKNVNYTVYIPDCVANVNLLPARLDPCAAFNSVPLPLLCSVHVRYTAVCSSCCTLNRNDNNATRRPKSTASQ